jgi:hypothetical protein
MNLKNFALASALFFTATIASLAASPQMGTWKLNEAKSTIPAGAPKYTTIVYAMDGKNLKVTSEGTDKDGQPMHTTWTGRFDGKPYPLTGDPTADTRTYRAVNELTTSLTNKKHGRVIVTGRVEVDAPGKLRTLNTTSTNSAGKKISATYFYEKQ